jgi:surfeit locus 1 family protein
MNKNYFSKQRPDLTGTVNLPGGYVITPFVLDDREGKDSLTILVNRGYVPYTHYSPTKRAHAQIDRQVELVGLLRKNEVAGTFTPVNNPPDEWHFRDINQMAYELNTAPIFLDAVYDTTIKGGPIGGQTNINLKNDHMTYLITWFSLSVLTSALWWQRYSRILF